MPSVRSIRAAIELRAATSIDAAAARTSSSSSSAPASRRPQGLAVALAEQALGDPRRGGAPLGAASDRAERRLALGLGVLAADAGPRERLAGAWTAPR